MSTVYCALALLEEIGAVRHVHLSRGPAVYEHAASAEVRHLVCVVCNHHVAVPAEVFDAVRGRLADEYGFVLEGSLRDRRCWRQLRYHALRHSRSVLLRQAQQDRACERDAQGHPRRVGCRTGSASRSRSQLICESLAFSGATLEGRPTCWRCIPDGFIDGPVSLLAGPWIVGIALCLRTASRTLDERQVPIVELVAACSCSPSRCSTSPSPAAPAATSSAPCWRPSSSGRQRGVPWPVTVVLVVQALLFADSGLSALGLNVVNMALVGAFGGYAVVPRLPAPPRALLEQRRARRRRSPRRRRRCWRRWRSRSSTPSAATTRSASAPWPGR